MKKTLLVIGLLGLSVTLAACETTGNTSNVHGLSSLSVECRTAGFDCTPKEAEAVVRSSSERVTRTQRVFSNSLRK